MVIAFQQVARSADIAMLSILHRLAEEHGHRNVFNPSFGRFGDWTLIAYRAVLEGGDGIRSYVAVQPRPGASFHVTDLTSIGDAHGLARVADPKVIDAGGAIYITFNTGFSPMVDNDIFLLRIVPRLGDLQRVVADFERQRVEKNWAFRLRGEDELMAIYQLHPYREVHLVSGDLGATGDLHFALREPHDSYSQPAAKLSIGTQLVSDGVGRHRLIAHEKWSIRRKRTYFGRAVSVEGMGTDRVEVRVGNVRLIHRWQDALPRRSAHNRNLLSATYFSGLMQDGDDVLLGYGVNDTDLSVARMKATDLWP